MTDSQEPGWEAEVAEIEYRRRLADELGGSAAVEKLHGQGRLTIRERIARLADPGSFQEVGKLTGQGHYVDGHLEGRHSCPVCNGPGISRRPPGCGWG